MSYAVLSFQKIQNQQKKKNRYLYKQEPQSSILYLCRLIALLLVIEIHIDMNKSLQIFQFLNSIQSHRFLHSLVFHIFPLQIKRLYYKPQNNYHFTLAMTVDVILHYCYKLISIKLLICFKMIKNVIAHFWTIIYTVIIIYKEYLRFGL